MRKRLLLLIMAMWALSVPTFAQTTLTVCDGTSTNGYIPFYGYYADAYTKSQFIFPATDLSSMAGGGIISEMKFYTQSTTSFGAATWKVYLMETTSTTFNSAYESVAAATMVYNGGMTITNNEMTVTFSTNYVYNGGNLLVCFEQQTQGSYSSCYFIGISSVGSSVAGYDFSSADMASASQKDFLPKTTFTYTPGDPNYCFQPKNLTISNITTTAADLVWEKGANENSWSLKWGVKGFDVDTEGTLVSSLSDTTYSFTGLTSGTKYDVYVKANCTATSNYSNWSKVSFKTLTVAATVPYVTDFSNAADNGQWDITEGINMFYTGSDSLGIACYSAGGALYISNDNGLTNAYSNTNTNAYAVRRINFPTAGNYVISYRWIAHGDYSTYSAQDYGRAFLAPGDHTLLGSIGWGALYDDWFCLDNTYGLYGADSWQVTNSEFVIVTPGEYQLIFYWKNDSYDSFTPAFSIDDVSVTALTCPAPIDFSATLVDTASATLQWTENGSATAWTIEYGVANFVQGTGTTVDVASDSCVITGLIANTQYDAYVKSNCSATDNSNWTKCTFRTTCPTYQSVPYFEDFDSYQGVTSTYSISENVLPDCWDYINPNTGSYGYLPTIYTYGSYAHSGTNSLYGSASLSSWSPVESSYALLPAFSNVSSLQLTLWGRASSTYSSYMSKVIIGVMDGSNDSTFQAVDTIEFTTTTYTEKVIYLDSYTGTNHTIAFYYPREQSTPYNYVYIDDITIDYIPNCKTPQYFKTASVGETSATLVWEDPNILAPDSYVVEYGLNGFVLGTGTQLTTTIDTVEITGLTLGTCYDAYLKTNCDSANSSPWVGPLTFTCGEIIVGTGTEYSSSCGWNSTYKNSWWQNLYEPSQINHAGLITSVAFYVGGVPSGGFTFNTADIYIAETNISYPSSWSSSDWVPFEDQVHVYSTTSLNINQTGWLVFELDEPFFYSGENKLAISLSKTASTYDYDLTWLSTYHSGYTSLYRNSDYDLTVAQYPTTSGSSSNYTINVKLMFGDASSYCIKPSQISLTNNGITDATIGWIALNGETEWALKYDTAGFDVETAGTLVSDIDTTVYTITNLTDSTTYDVYVKSVCTDSTSSAWAGPFTFTTLPACAAPTNFLVLGSTASTITIGWTPGYLETQWEVEYDTTGFTQGAGTVVTVNNNPTVTINNLVEGTTYDFYVRSVCSATMNSVWAGPFTKTLGEITIGEGTVSYEYLPFYGYYGYGYSQQIYLASEMQGPCMISAVKFYCTQTPSGSTGANKIWMGNVSKSSFENKYDYVSPSDLSLVYDMGEGVAWSVQQGWNTLVLDEPFVYDGTSNLLVAFYEGMSGYSSAKWMCHTTTTNMSVMHYSDYSSNVSYEQPESASGSSVFNKYRNNIKLMFSAIDPNYCFKPSKVTAVAIDTATAVANWITSAPSVDIIWGLHGFAMDSTGTTVTVTDTTYTFTGLASNTLYDFYIRANCSDTNHSDYRGPISFRTPCGTFTNVPFNENFDSWTAVSSYWGSNGNNLPDCWNYINVFTVADHDSYDFPLIMNQQANSGTNSIYFYSNYDSSYYYTTDYGQQYAILPPFNNLSDMQVEFWGKGAYDSYSSVESTLILGIMTDPDSAATFVALDTITLSSDMFTYHILYLSQYTGTGKYIAFYAPYATEADYNAFYIDDITVDLIPDCPPVTNLTVIGVDTASATVGWTENGSATAWEIEYGLIGYTEGQGTLVQANTNPFTITGLTNSTGYKFNVRPTCGGNWSVQPRVFYTAQVPATLPYSCGFEATDPETSKWTLENGTETNQWFIGNDMFNYGHYSGQQGLYISYEQVGSEVGIVNYYNLTSASKVFAYRTFNLNAGTYVASFRYKVEGEQGCDYVRAFLAPTSAILTAGNNCGVTATGTPDGWVALGGELSEANDWQYFYDEEIIVPDSGFYNLVFCWINDASGGNYPAPAIDDVQLFAMTCPLPLSATCTATDASTATISWVEQGTATEWNIEYGAQGFTQGTGTIVNTTTNPYTITDLQSSTAYEAYVQAVCGADDVSGWRGPVQFTTAGCEAYEKCPITLILTDQAPDGWMGNKVTVYNGANLVNEYTMFSGTTTKTYTIPLCPGEVSFYWTLGAFPNECGIMVIGNAGDTLYTCTDGSTLTDGAVFFSFTHECEDACDGPTNLTATQTTSSVALTWTAVEGVSSYSVYRNNTKIANDLTVTNYNDVITTNGNYCYKVVSNCENGSESQPSNEVCIETTISVSENAAETANIYPNPTNNKVKVEAAGMTRIEVMSIVGQHIYTTEVETDEFEFDFSSFEAGVYMMRIETTTGAATKRITVVK